MQPFYTNIDLDVQRLQEYLISHPKEFDKYPQRRIAEGSPHSEMTDIWVRYRDPAPFIESGDWSTFGDEHDSTWYSEFHHIPDVKRLCRRLMYATGGTRLGGVLITKLPPGGKIAMHTDGNWHASYYEKFYVPIQNALGSELRFKGLKSSEGQLYDRSVCPKDGEVWWFDNSETHGVVNNSNIDRLAMIVCIRRT